mgnify:CR=1 FL=1
MGPTPCPVWTPPHIPSLNWKPRSYEIDNAGPQYVALPNGGSNTVTVTFLDSPEITSEGSIRKVDADDPTKGLAGAVIKIEGTDNSFTGTYTTGAGGYLEDVPGTPCPSVALPRRRSRPRRVLPQPGPG